MPDTTIDADALGRWLRAFAAAIAEQKDALTALDAEIGDADHGANMDRGMQAVVAELDGAAGGDPAAVLKRTGMALVRSVGGASGPLYGTLFLRMATAAGSAGLGPAGFSACLRAGLDGVAARGKAEPGDKTMIDALSPAVAALAEAVAAGRPLAEALRDAAVAAERGRDATTPMVARKGRASYLGERSAGHQDPGATSAALLIATAADTLAG
ncbi:dihydroxyacetone kinase subunit L [Pseudonocardia sp. C8]|uniref:dihydroxyacetone kinase subunit DhaL n=1 Tax=Pseudonocardia sp. C8 TaxID=2762759 RepID=UPI0016430B20|nr:dihydroxyacetone kinase subunit DhaL [Pseudonocardia sp. C8]MBC3193087.1 dihydroxyacetone kinase subunit L [Pseudonocardia sp. C8]